MTFCKIVSHACYFSCSLTGIVQHVYDGSCHVPTTPALNDSLVRPISPIIACRCYIRVLIGYSRLCDWGCACPRLAAGCCGPLKSKTAAIRAALCYFSL